jgi:mannosyltransferase OCH1-like enzyme
MISKIIFQTYETKYQDLPEHYKQTSLSWQNLNQDWSYVYHDKDQRREYVKTFCPEMYKIYNRIVKPHQADLWRYLILRNEGGVYADMDSFCVAPMNYVLDQLPEGIDIVCTKTELNDHTNNANFAAVKRSKILSDCIETILVANRKERQQPDQEIIHQCFSDGILNNPDLVSKTMRAEHGATYKRAFNSNDMTIDYYGQEMTYLEFLSNHGMV